MRPGRVASVISITLPDAAGRSDTRSANLTIGCDVDVSPTLAVTASAGPTRIRYGDQITYGWGGATTLVDTGERTRFALSAARLAVPGADGNINISTSVSEVLIHQLSARDSAGLTASRTALQDIQVGGSQLHTTYYAIKPWYKSRLSPSWALTASYLFRARLASPLTAWGYSRELMLIFTYASKK